MNMPWQEKRTGEQNDLFQSACGDLAAGWDWHGHRMSKDDWRHLICAFVLNKRPVPGIEGGLVVLGGSSKDLRLEQATKAITLAFAMGDAPWEYDKSRQHRIRWGDVVCAARGITDNELMHNPPATETGD